MNKIFKNFGRVTLLACVAISFMGCMPESPDGTKDDLPEDRKITVKSEVSGVEFTALDESQDSNDIAIRINPSTTADVGYIYTFDVVSASHSEENLAIDGSELRDETNTLSKAYIVEWPDTNDEDVTVTLKKRQGKEFNVAVKNEVSGATFTVNEKAADESFKATFGTTKLTFKVTGLDKAKTYKIYITDKDGKEVNEIAASKENALSNCITLVTVDDLFKFEE